MVAIVTGTIPSELGLLTGMTRLGLHVMDLTGPIPSELGTMSHMKKLLLHDNALTGTIPTELASMSNLEAFTVSHTSLTGSIPEELCYGVKEVNMTCLSYFGVEGNVCTGFTISNFSCSDESMLCGCSCGGCPN